MRAAYQLTNYLLDHGHTHIAFLSPPAEDTSTIEERIQGFMLAFSHRGLSLNPEFCFDKLVSTLPQSCTEYHARSAAVATGIDFCLNQAGCLPPCPGYLGRCTKN